MNPLLLCMGCMGHKGTAEVCSNPDCRWREGTLPESVLQLPPRTVLAGKYYLGRVLGQGGFGITYLGWDLTLNRKLAIKEHFPRDFCSRARDGHTVKPTSRNEDSFAHGLKSFEKEGSALAQFHHAGIVTMLDFVRENGTAYIVMAYVGGQTFEEYLQDHGKKISFDVALNILLPVMDALRYVHKLNWLHRDVSPGNIHIDQQGRVTLLDFGSARQAMREQAQNLTVEIKKGYSPIEQQSTSEGRQGPWTDVYAVGATLYRAITGRLPASPTDRLVNDALEPPSRLSVEIPPEAGAALLKALAVRPEHRFASIEEFLNAILPAPRPPVTPPPRQLTRSDPPQPVKQPEIVAPDNVNVPPQVLPAEERHPIFLGVATALLLLVVAGVIASMWESKRRVSSIQPQLPVSSIQPERQVVESPKTPPVLTVHASSRTIQAGQTVTLDWSCSNCTDVYIDGTRNPRQGSMSVAPQRNTSYIFSANGIAGTASEIVPIVVRSSPSPPPTPQPGPAVKNESPPAGGPATDSGRDVVTALPVAVRLRASVESIRAGQTVTLMWESTNATQAEIEDIGPVTPTDSMTVMPVRDTAYVIKVVGRAGGTASDTVTVRVTPAPVPPPPPPTPPTPPPIWEFKLKDGWAGSTFKRTLRVSSADGLQYSETSSGGAIRPRFSAPCSRIETAKPSPFGTQLEIRLGNPQSTETLEVVDRTQLADIKARISQACPGK